MTAIVGILNKRAAAIAADSAMTVTQNGKTKIYNNTRKIFCLSPSIPMGIMFYSRAEFMGIPLDVILNLYREYRNGKPLKRLRDYSKDFIKFLSKCDTLNSADVYSNYLYSELSSFYYLVKDDVEELKVQNDKEDNVKQDADVSEYVRSAISKYMEVFKDDKVSPEMKGLTYRKFCNITQDHFSSLEELLAEDKMPAGMIDEWKKGFFEYIRSGYYLQNSGIVFVGYGEKDIYPAIHSTIITGIIDGRIRYFDDEDDGIAKDNSSIIIPFAQTDVMLTMMKGIAPELYRHIGQSHEDTMEKARNLILDTLKDSGVCEGLLEKVKNISFDSLNEGFNDMNQDFIKENYVDGILSALDCFSIEEMAEMAENLISVTGLQRHFSSSEESVGGPVEVAVITKADGFKWVKHKEY